MSDELHEAARRLRAAVLAATAGLVGREQMAELIVLAAVASEHLLIVGPPGTAKSAVVRRVAGALGGRYFEYLIGRFTEPSELFGPIDLRRLREGVVETDVSGMLPEAEVAFLDEVFLGSTAVLNTLLGVLNERRFRRGHTQLDCPLRVCVGATNALPEDEALAAFADRFLLHLFVEPVPDAQLEDLLAGGWEVTRAPAQPLAGVADVDRLGAAVAGVEMSAARGALATAVRALRKGGLNLSDRRIVKAQRLVAAAAVLAGRRAPTEADLWPLFYVMPTHEAQQSAQELLREHLAVAAHPTLQAAVELAALAPRSRLARLAEAAAACLALTDLDARRARAEQVLREIDANFASDALPAELAPLRPALLVLAAGG